jgi:L-ribulose-5-phosphate 3-epimerase
VKIRALGINTYGFIWSTPMADCVRSLHALGYDEFEVVINPPHLSLDDSSRAQRESLAGALRAEGIRLRSLNLPSLDANLASPMARTRAYSVQMFRDAIDLAADLGIAHLITVPGRMNPLLAPSPQQRQMWMAESLHALLPHAQARGVGLALENVPFASFPDARSLGDFVRSMDSPDLSVCYDVANAHFIGESPVQGLRQLGKLVSIVHLSDTTRTAWRHDEVGRGDVAFGEVAQVLAETGFEGSCMLEIIDPNPTQVIVRSHRALAELGFPSCPAGAA